jgi:high-affinity nickel-transport protein
LFGRPSFEAPVNPVSVTATPSAKGWIDSKTLAIFAALIVVNGLAWAWAYALFSERPAILGTALLAWVFGLRHGVDADHIAAIDNVVRKLMQQGQKPRTAGLFFSLGHSTVVIAAAMLLAIAAAAAQEGMTWFKTIGAVVGTLVSAGFLLIIAAINIVILIGVWRTFRAVSQGAALDHESLDMLLSGRGFLAWLFHPMFRIVTRSWHMYPLGFLFGLGFDTATEIGLLSISAAEAAKGMPAINTLVFPALFTAGMALVDTADSALIVGAYGWAFVNPIRKLWYNLTITGASVMVAVFIGGVEALALLADRMGLEGGFWKLIGDLNDSLANFGFVVVGLFVVAWILSAAIYKARNYDALAGAAPQR